MCSAKCLTIVVLALGLVLSVLSVIAGVIRLFVFENKEEVRELEAKGLHPWAAYTALFGVPAIIIAVYLFALVGVVQKIRCLMWPFVACSCIAYVALFGSISIFAYQINIGHRNEDGLTVAVLCLLHIRSPHRHLLMHDVHLLPPGKPLKHGMSSRSKVHLWIESNNKCLWSIFTVEINTNEERIMQSN